MLASYLSQVLQDGVFHADSHPGNILIDREGTLHLLDFGSTGILDATILDGLNGITLAIKLNDGKLFQRAVLTLAPAPPEVDMPRLSSDLTRFLAVHGQQGSGFDLQLFKAMAGLLRRHRISKFRHTASPNARYTGRNITPPSTWLPSG